MTEAEFRELEERRLRALVAADMETARDLHAEDYELIPPGGGTLSKADYLDQIESGALNYTTFEADSPMRVRLHEAGGVARYIARIEIDVDGYHDEGRFWHTDVWERGKAGWQAVWSQATRIRMDDAASPASIEEQLIES